MKVDLKNMKFGVATAATQIEGGDKNNDWYAWYEKGHIKDGSDPSVACKHYERTQGDADLLSKMGMTEYRMGIEWSRIEPQQGKFDAQAIQHYRDEILYLQSKGVRVLLTLHHFTLPLWFSKMGGFETEACFDIFDAFTAFVVKGLGDIVEEYVTINEPNVYAFSGYIFGEFPPGKTDRKLAKKVMANMAVCHIRAYQLIHKMRSLAGYQNTKVAFAHHLRVFEPKKRTPFKILANNYIKKLFQEGVTDAFVKGDFSTLKMPKGVNLSKGDYCDFIGINYYSRSITDGLRDGVKENSPRNDLNWEIYPEGLRAFIDEYSAFQKPIYITENGTADRDDAFRSRFLYEHLEAISRAKVLPERYYHWTFYDNFEWLEGFTGNFGLVALQPDTLNRVVRQSGEFYSRIISDGGIAEESYKKYAEGQRYKRA